jgi:hypothetical protein
MLFPEVSGTAAATPPPAENEEDSDDICKTLLVEVSLCRGNACILKGGGPGRRLGEDCAAAILHTHNNAQPRAVGTDRTEKRFYIDECSFPLRVLNIFKI